MGSEMCIRDSGDVMTDELETGMTDPLGDVGLPPSEVIVKTDHLLPSLHEPVDQMGAKEPGTPSDKVNLHAQGLRNVSTIAAIPLSATVISSPCCCSGFNRTSPR